MRSLPDSTIRPTHLPEPSRGRRTVGRGRGVRRRTLPPMDEVPERRMTSAEALYRAEKARRAADKVDSALMLEAKQLYDAAVAETSMKRAGMRSRVVAPRATSEADGAAA